MSIMSIKYNVDQHATANPSNVVSGGTYGGHMFSIQLDTDTDNGNLIAVGEWIGLDLFAEAAVTKFEGKIVEKMSNGNYLVLVEDPGDAVLVYSVPVGAEDWTNNWKKESNLYNEAGSIARAYELKKWDRFEVSAEGFNGTPEVGKSITGVADKKMTIGA